jgi:hypothetical protein
MDALASSSRALLGIGRLGRGGGATHARWPQPTWPLPRLVVLAREPSPRNAHASGTGSLLGTRLIPVTARNPASCPARRSSLTGAALSRILLGPCDLRNTGSPTACAGRRCLDVYGDAHLPQRLQVRGYAGWRWLSLALAKLRRCRADNPERLVQAFICEAARVLASAIDRSAWLSYSERRAVFWCSPPWPGTVVAAVRRLWLVRSARQIQCTC